MKIFKYSALLVMKKSRLPINLTEGIVVANDGEDAKNKVTEAYRYKEIPNTKYNIAIVGEVNIIETKNIPL